MNLKQLLDDPTKLHRVGYIVLWCEAALGALLLWQTSVDIMRVICIGLLAVAALCMHAAAKHRLARVTARIVAGFSWLIVLLFLAQIILSVLFVWDAKSVYPADVFAQYSQSLYQSLHNGCLVFCQILCYLIPAAGAVMLYGGAHATGYDRFAAVLFQTALLPIGGVVLFADSGFSWTWTLDGTVLPYAWGVLAVAATVATWACARVLSPEQAQGVAQRRNARREKREARQKRRETLKTK